MTSRARIALTALGLTLGILVLFVGTVWVLMATVSEDGLPTGGAKVAVVEIEGIILDGGQAVRDLREHGDNPSVKAVVVRINSPGGVVAPTQEIFSAVQRLRKGGRPVVASLGAVAASAGFYVATADGRIYSGQQAHALKMVDELGGYEDAIDAAGKLANIPGRPKIVYPRRKFSFRDLMENRLGLSGAAGQLLPALSGIRTPLYLMQ